MKVCVVTPRFAIAGVPLAQIRFARALAKRGHDVVMVVGHVNKDCTFPDVDGLKVHIWKKPKVRDMLFPLIRFLKTEKPDVVFAAEDHLNAILLLAAILSGSKAKISGSSRVTPFDTYSNRLFSKRWMLKQVVRTVMWRANVLTCVSKDMVEQYRKIFSNPSHVCVYNIVDDAQSRTRIEESVEHPWVNEKQAPLLVAAGRLAPWKGFDDLIKAVELVLARTDVRLLIMGDGPLRDELQSLIDSRGLTEKIELVGYVDNPLKYFARADVFVLSSHVEGLPNVLVEAMMCGCTPVSTDCPTGPREVLQDGKYGYLAPMRDPAALALAIDKAIETPVDSELLAEAVLPFEENTVIDRHFDLLGLEG
ncbi:glycosyltransferase [Solemya elarraichensis gill symbiont]|uniref:glycosyltransferase n=1 Tax=Solemya elarraichensis gill symbiont TaxID=1918949 RepID=UPI00099885C0|nr:glycosyltransferase [Solemya elarraichensis gill symbiont]